MNKSFKDIGDSLAIATYIWEVVDVVCELQAKCSTIKSETKTTQLLTAMLAELAASEKSTPSNKLISQVENFHLIRKSYPEMINTVSNEIAEIKEINSKLHPRSTTAKTISKNIRALKSRIKNFKTVIKNESVSSNIILVIDQLKKDVTNFKKNLSYLAAAKESLNDLNKEAAALNFEITELYNKTYGILLSLKSDPKEIENLNKKLSINLKDLQNSIKGLQYQLENITDNKTLEDFIKQLESVKKGITTFKNHADYHSLKRAPNEAQPIFQAYSKSQPLVQPVLGMTIEDFDHPYLHLWEQKTSSQPLQLEEEKPIIELEDTLSSIVDSLDSNVEENQFVEQPVITSPIKQVANLMDLAIPKEITSQKALKPIRLSDSKQNLFFQSTHQEEMAKKKELEALWKHLKEYEESDEAAYKGKVIPTPKMGLTG